MNTSPHIGIAGPIACEELRDLLDDPRQTLPAGYGGAPLMSVLIRELLTRGLRISAFTTSSDLPAQDVFRATGSGFELVVVPARRRAWRPNGLRLGRIIDGFAIERRMLAEAMQRSGPDLVHAHWTYEFALGALASGLPTLVTCHDASWEVFRHTRSPYRLIRHLMAREVFRRATHLTTVSPYMRSLVQPHAKGEVAVVANPIAAYVVEASRSRTLPTTRRIAMVCNGWDRRKNPETGIRAFSIFRRSRPDAELHLFGTAFESGHAGENWAKANGLLEGVRFHGVVPHRELIEQLQSMDLLLHPALEESFGVIIAEAMALGLPVVAGSGSGAVPWVAGLKEGAASSSLLCDVSSGDAVAAMIEQAFDSQYGERSSSGVVRSQALSSPSRVASQYSEIYAQLVRGMSIDACGRCSRG